VALLTTGPPAAPTGVAGAGAGVVGPPIACALTGAQQQARVGEWAAVLTRALGRRPVPGGLRLTFPTDPALAGQLAGLAAAERACCPFFEFTLELTAAATVLHVHAPAGAATLVQDVFGPAGAPT
jgi:hypothetical protein